jgi:hypothetical protein
MRHLTTAGAALGLALALLAAGCAPAEDHEDAAVEEATGMPADEGAGGGELGAGEPPPEGAPADEAEQIFLEGRLTDEGVECPAFRSDQDELYTLTGDLGGFGPGDQVRIVGEPVAISTCMQGTTVQIIEISAIEEEPPGG